MRQSVVHQRSVTVNDVTIEYLQAGDGPLALCLHGFPDVADGWRPLLAALADAGWSAVVPYQRGYAPSGLPSDGGSLPSWIADAGALHEALGGDGDAVVIGHDWGALCAYATAAQHPERWARVVAASIPPLSVMADRLFDYDQLKRFWYQYLFLTATAEDVIAAGDFAFLDHLWRDWSPAFDPSEALGPVRAALAERANRSVALSTYRALHDPALVPERYAAELTALFTPHAQPTLYLHGDRDGCVAADVVPAVSDALPAGSQVEVLPGAGHFLQYEQPDRVTDLILAFLG